MPGPLALPLVLPRFLQPWLPRRWRTAPAFSDRLWQHIVGSHPFLQALDPAELNCLRSLSGHFLQEKEFSGAHGLKVDDRMALTIAAQACLPLLHMPLPSGRAPARAAELLVWYDDFVGIVIQPGAALAQREAVDGSGVVHRWREPLAGEAMDRGPIMLSWQDVAHAAGAAEHGANVVIHEFVHKMDMRGMPRGRHPDGAPPLFTGFLGERTAQAATERWHRTMAPAYEHFREAVALAERFGAEPPWLDAYAATDPAEFFAVTSEAYFVQRVRFGATFPTLLALYDGFFRCTERPPA